MKFISYLLLICLTLSLAGCKKDLAISGTTSIPELEGRTLYLRIFSDGDLQVVDSADVTHGKFQFTNYTTEADIMAFLFLGEESIMPLVVDKENQIQITINKNERKVEGSALNDTLFAFIKRKSVIDQQLAELPHRESQMILEGLNHDEIIRELNQEAAVLNAKEEAMVMRFIKNQMDNVLAPGVFMIVTSTLPYPVLNPQIEELVALASPIFLNDPYVTEYLKMAEENMEKLKE